MTRAISPGPLVGAVHTSRSLPTFTITETTYAPGLAVGKHAHPFPYFCAVLQGAFDDTVGHTERLFRNSTVFFRPREEVHADKFRPSGARCLVIELKPRLLENLEAAASQLKASSHFSGGTLFSLSLRLQDELQKWDAFSPLAAEGLIYEMISVLCRLSSGSPSAAPAWLRAADEFILQHFNSPLTLSAVASAVRVHPTHLARVFRQVHRCTVGEYIRRQRIQFCCDKLARPDLPLAAIALDAGFADQSHFCRTFKRTVGQSPATYRRRILEERR